MESRGGRHLYCDPCRKIVSNETNKELEREKRRASGIAILGSERSCKICGDSFAMKNGQQLYCEPCSDKKRTEGKTAINIRYRQRHGERLRQKERQWCAENADVVRERNRRWEERNPDGRRAVYKRYYRSRKDDPMFALNYRMRHGIWRSVKEHKKGQPWEGFVEYTVDELRTHLERQFLPGMGWHNMGKWHIDHVIPLKLHKFGSPEDPDFKAAWSLSNLRPLWAEDNLRKNAKRLTLL